MENNKLNNTKNDKLPFFFSDWIIVALSFLWFMYGIPLIVAIGLIIYRNRKSKRISIELFNEYLGFEELQAKIELEKNNAKINAEKIKENLVVEERKLKNENDKLNILIKSLNIEIEKLKQDKKNIQDDIIGYEKELIHKVVDTRDYSEVTSMQLKNELQLISLNEKELLNSNEALIINSQDSKKNINYQIKQILRSFNAETENIISKLTISNVDSSRGKLVKTFEVLNNIFKVDGIELSKKLLDIKLQEFNIIHQYQVKIEQEKEQQRAIKEQMVEEEKVRREIEREKAKLDKEEKQFKNEVSKLIAYLQKTDNDIEKNLYMDKIKELEEKLTALEKDKENVLQRELNTRAGFVYIISNIGSFGENVYKIGMTRRLEPMDRVKELGSASVPFEFDVHAMIFSEDAPTLETTLHQHFRKHEVNKVNPRKEFFRVNLKDIEEVVKENHNATVEFTLIAKAEQYRESVRIEQMGIETEEAI